MSDNTFLPLRKGANKEEMVRKAVIVAIEYHKERNKRCFIATAVYGSQESQEVIILRRFRDKILMKTFFGKLFIIAYYKMSPYLADLIEKKPKVKRLLRKLLLDPIVKIVSNQK